VSLFFEPDRAHNVVMSMTLDFPPSLRDRVEAIAKRSNLTASQVIADALENGHSLEWQERFLEKVEAGITAADGSAFASADDLRLVANRYRPT